MTLRPLSISVVTALLLAAATASAQTASPSLNDAWRVEEPPPPLNPDGTPAPSTVSRVRLVTRQGRPIPVAEGLADVGFSERLVDRVKQKEKLEGGLDPFIVQRGVVFGVGGGLAAAGVVGAVVGGAITAIYAVTRVPPPGARALVELPRIGPAMLLIGIVAVGIGIIAIVASSIMTALRFANPPPPNPVLMESMGGSVWWDPQEAREVAISHNKRFGIVLEQLEVPPPPRPVPPPPQVTTTPADQQPGTTTTEQQQPGTPTTEQQPTATPGEQSPTPPAEDKSHRPRRGRGKRSGGGAQ